MTERSGREGEGTPPFRCPVCRSPYRGKALCPRCGADLSPSIRLRLRALRKREEAWRALLRGRTAQALRAVEESLLLHAVPWALRLRLVVSMLHAAESSRGPQGGGKGGDPAAGRGAGPREK